MPSRLHAQYQESLHFTWRGQLPAPPIFDCALEMFLAASGQLCREEPGWGQEHLQTPPQAAETPARKPLLHSPWFRLESCRNLVT